MGIISSIKSAYKSVKKIVTGKSQTGAVLNATNSKLPALKSAPKPSVITNGKTYYGDAGKKQYEKDRSLLPSRKVEVIGVSNKKPASNESDYNVVSRGFTSTPGSTAKKTISGGGSSGGGGSSRNDTALSAGQFNDGTFSSDGVTYDSTGKAITGPKLKSTEQSTMLRQGANGSNIAQIQAKLGITSDGIFGPQTKSAIMKFQQDNGLTVDGVVGPQTLAALQGTTTANGVTAATGSTISGPTVSGPTGTNLSAPGYTPLSTTPVKDKQTETTNYNDTLNSDAQATADALAETNGGADIPTSASDKMLKALADMVENKPDAPKSQAEILAKKRKQLAIDPLEKRLNDIDERDARLDAEKEKLFAEENNRQVSVLQINRRKNQEQIQYEDEKRLIAIERDSVANELKQKYDVLDSFMKYSNMDYENSVNAYNTQFSQAISMINLVKGIENDKKSDKERAQDNAKANATLLINTFKDSGVNYGATDPATKAMLTKMSLQMGLPANFMQSAIKATSPKTPKSTSTSTTASLKTDINSAVSQLQNIVKTQSWYGVNPDDYQTFADYIQKTYGVSAVASFKKAISDVGLKIDVVGDGEGAN